VLELLGTEDAILVAVEYPECVDQFLEGVGILVLFFILNQILKLLETKTTNTLDVYFLYHLYNLCLSRVKSQRSHNSAKL
jgi:hypothetical protein